MNSISTISVLLPLLAAGVGYWLRYYLDRKKELTSEVNKERRVVYQQMVDMLFGILEKVKHGDKQSPKEIQKLIEELYKIYRKEVLYASSGVINAFNDFMQFSYRTNQGIQQNPHDILWLLSNLLAAMRKDLGLSNKGLGKDHRKLLRALISDMDNL